MAIYHRTSGNLWVKIASQEKTVVVRFKNSLKCKNLLCARAKICSHLENISSSSKTYWKYFKLKRSFVFLCYEIHLSYDLKN